VRRPTDPGTENALADDISRVLRKRGAESRWLAHLSHVSSRMQMFEWALLRRSSAAAPNSEQSGDPTS